MILLNITNRILEKSLKFGNLLISLNFQGDNSVDCGLISCGWSSRSEKKNWMPWTSSICECSVTQNCQRGRKHLLENFIYKTYHSLLWILNGLRLSHRHFNFRTYLVIYYYNYCYNYYRSLTLYTYLLCMPNSVKGPWQF